MKPDLVIVQPLHEAARGVLERHEKDLKWKLISENQIDDEIINAHFLIARALTPLSKERIQKAKNLKLIVIAGAGFDQVDLEACNERGIFLMNAQEANSTSAAELTLGLLLNLMRHLPAANSATHLGQWAHDIEFRRRFMGAEIAGRTVGIVGLGRVGKRVADRLKAFEAQVIACDPYLTKKEAGATPLMSYDDLLSKVDILSFHCPLNPETKDYFSKASLSKLSKPIYLLNAARGAIVNEAAVLEGLELKKILGYGADVFSVEPLPDNHPFLKHLQIFLSPHLGAQTEEAQRNVSVMAVQRVIDFLSSGRPKEILNTKKKKKT